MSGYPLLVEMEVLSPEEKIVCVTVLPPCEKKTLNIISVKTVLIINNCVLCMCICQYKGFICYYKLPFSI